MIHLRRTLAALAALAALGTGPARAEAVWLAHYVPAIQEPVEITIEVAGVPALSRAIAYGDAVRVDVELPANVRFTARRSGAVLVEATTNLGGIDHTVALGGQPGTLNVGAHAPVLDFYIAEDDRRTLAENQFGFRTSSLAVVPAGSTEGPTITITNGTTSFPGGPQQFGDDFRRSNGPPALQGFGFSTHRNAPCRAELHARAAPIGLPPPERAAYMGAPVDAFDFACLPGRLYRLVAIGDGATAPYRLRLIDVNAVAIRPLVPATAAMNGVWSIEGEPGAGLSIAIDTDAQGEMTLRGLLYGYVAGEPRWRFVESDSVPTLHAVLFVDVAEYAGGSPDGERATVGLSRGIAQLSFHACDRATLFAPYPTQIGLRGSPGRSYDLVRMLPARPCATPATEQGATP